MKLRLEILLLISLFLVAIVPLSIYSTILEENNITQNNTTILNVPDVRQPTNFSCGATSLQAVLAYYGTDKRVDELMNLTNTSENGTTPDNIARAAGDLGFSAEVKENMTLQDLVDNLNQGIPTIVACQAWKDNTTGNWTNDTEDGHYMVVIGMDDQNVYFEDPAILGSRGYIPIPEFLERWHDQSVISETENSTENNTGNNTTTTTTFNHLGIVITGGQAVNFPPFIKIE